MGLKGKVTFIYNEGKKAKVLVKPLSNCNGCKACAGLIKNSKAANDECEIDVFTNQVEIKIGDFVKVEMTEYQGSKTAIILYAIPIIGFLSGMLLAPYLCTLLSLQVNDIARVIGSFLGLFISIKAIAIYLRYQKPESFMMGITEKLSDNKG